MNNPESDMTPAAVDSAPPSLPTQSRRHDLDALRAVAMLLGIALHAGLSFMPGLWPVQDSRQNDVFGILFSAVHGFRMPLFFVLSGFFTAMLWRKRGLRALIGHRFKRIFLPLMLFMVTVIPFQIWVIINVSRTAPAKPENRKTASHIAGPDIWSAVRSGDTNALHRHRADGADMNAKDPQWGSTPIAIAAVYGRTNAVEWLIANGADANARNKDGGTALHGAAFLGHPGIVDLLLRAGADFNARNQRGETPMDSMAAPWGVTRFVAGLIQIKVDQKTVEAGRAECAELLRKNGAKIAPSPAATDAGAKRDSGPLLGIMMALMLVPVFHHLWFLWFLCWLVAAFALYAVIADRMKWITPPRWLIASPVNLLWLVPLTIIPQSMMGKMMPVFGPDTSLGILPVPQVLIYYAIFFGFGVLYYDCKDEEGRLGKRWYISLPLALLIVFPIGLEFTTGGLGFRGRVTDASMYRPISVFMQVVFAWTMSFGFMGLFRAVLRRESQTMRYLSDSSYWLYVAHLPLIFFAQSVVRDWPLPAVVKFGLVCVVVSGFLLLTYQLFVRYTWLGTLMNGPRKRPEKSSAT